MIDQLICRCTVRRRSFLPVLLSAMLLTAGFSVRIAFPRTGLWALLAFGGGAAVTAGLYLAIRYLAKRYTYTLEQRTDGRVDFTVEEQNFLRRTTVCRIATEQIISLSAVSACKRPLRGCRRYHYCADVRPKDACLLHIIETDGSEAVIRSTPDENFKKILALLVPSKKDEEISD